MAESEKVKRELQKLPGKKPGYWMTTRAGKRIFIERDDYQKWAVRGAIGVVGATVAAIVGRKIGLFVPQTLRALDPRRWIKVARDAWKGRHMLAALIKNNTSPGLPGFKSSVRVFSPLNKDQFYFEQDMSQGPAKIGTLKLLIDKATKTAVIKDMTVTNFEEYKFGLGKAFRNLYDTAMELKIEKITATIPKGEQGVTAPVRMGFTWANKDIEFAYKDQAKDLFDKFIGSLPAEEKKLWPTTKIKKLISTAGHPQEIVTGDGAKGNWKTVMGSSLQDAYLDRVGPYIGSNIDPWEGAIFLGKDYPQSHATFARFVHYGTAEAPKGINNWLNRLSNYFFKELDPRPEGMPMTSSKGKSYTQPIAKVNMPWVKKRIEEAKLGWAQKVAEKYGGVMDTAAQTLENRVRAWEEYERKLDLQLKAAKSAVERTRLESERALKREQFRKQIKKETVKIQNVVDERRLEGFVKNQLEERHAKTGQVFGPADVKEAARQMKASMSKGEIDDFLAHTKIVVVTEGRTIKFNTKDGTEKELEWFKDAGKKPRTYLRLPADDIVFRLEPTPVTYRHQETGKPMQQIMFQITPFNKNAGILYSFPDKPLPLNRKFYSEDDATRYFINWVQTSGNLKDYYNPAGTPGNMRMLVTSVNKKFTWAINPYKDANTRRAGETTVGDWEIEAIGKAKNTHEFGKKRFKNREEAEIWLDQYIKKANL